GTRCRCDSRWRWRGSDTVARRRARRSSWPPVSPTRLALGPHELAPEVLLSSQRVMRATAQREIVRSGWPTQCMRTHMVHLEKRRFPTALAPVVVAVKQAETQNVCGEDSAGTRSVWSVRETVLYEAERTSVQRPRRAVLYETVNTLFHSVGCEVRGASPPSQEQRCPALASCQKI